MKHNFVCDGKLNWKHGQQHWMWYDVTMSIAWNSITHVGCWSRYAATHTPSKHPYAVHFAVHFWINFTFCTVELHLFRSAFNLQFHNCLHSIYTRMRMHSWRSRPLSLCDQQAPNVPCSMLKNNTIMVNCWCFFFPAFISSFPFSESRFPQ